MPLATPRDRRRREEKPKRMKCWFVFCVLIALLSTGTTADVSLPADDDLVDLSWPYNSHALQWVTFRNFSMKVVHDTHMKYNGYDVW